jgi:Family of unknown function (DUF6428)
MTTNEFISALRAGPDNELMFTNLDGYAVHSGYHLTELKAASFETVDCGGQTNRWQETIVQLWVPANPDDDYMTAAKFLKIFDKVCGLIALDIDAEVRVEYGDQNFFSSVYYIRSVTSDQTTTRVLLEPPRTTCKARDRRMTSMQFSNRNDSCCLAAKACC